MAVRGLTGSGRLSVIECNWNLLRIWRYLIDSLIGGIVYFDKIIWLGTMWLCLVADWLELIKGKGMLWLRKFMDSFRKKGIDLLSLKESSGSRGPFLESQSNFAGPMWYF